MDTPVIGFFAPSGTGKTTLIEQITHILSQRGYVVSVIKYGHHKASPDIPGKDSDRFRRAGAESVFYAGPSSWFQVREHPSSEQPDPRQLLPYMDDPDLVLVEGYKAGDIPKILVHRQGIEIDPIDIPTPLLAVVSDDPNYPTDCPVLPLNDAEAVANHMMDLFFLI
ncbi:molybdopterin-guanine dinucleotide biosynthesis protein B [Magnetococcus sp. PR-3]|uniref:molybdopterin-guanine dinucleotide biosynthesis protein B n=1 Tax=Magnetococcus sp. PR-3 TaxID=3120355 RepID=UPI002FCE64AA